MRVDKDFRKELTKTDCDFSTLYLKSFRIIIQTVALVIDVVL